MTEKSEASLIPSNVMRTIPYTAYIAVGSYAVVFRSSKAAWLEGGLLSNEILNAALKKMLRKIAGPEATLLQRPPGACDAGIYPQHYPKTSISSGMPSGHSQTSAFLAVALSSEILLQAGCSPTDGCMGDAALSIGAVISLSYVWLIAALVVVSRTRFGGFLAVSVDGHAVAVHTLPQVMVGTLVGACFGKGGVQWYYGHAWVLWVVVGMAIATCIGTVAWLLREPKGSSRVGSDADKSDESDTDRSTRDGSESCMENSDIFSFVVALHPVLLHVDHQHLGSSQQQ